MEIHSQFGSHHAVQFRELKEVLEPLVKDLLHFGYHMLLVQLCNL